MPVRRLRRNESQPRRSFDAAALAALAESIAESGIVQPVAVRPLRGGDYELVAGERRWLAAQQLGLDELPAIVHDVDDRTTLVMALVENLVREDLNALETAHAYALLQDDFGMSVSEIARSVGRSRPAVSNTLRLLELPDDVLELIGSARLSEGHGRALLGCRDRLQIRRLARLALERSLSVRALEALVREAELPPRQGEVSRGRWNRRPAPELVERVELLAEQCLGVRARLRVGDAAGRLEFECDGEPALLELVERLEAALATA